MDSSTCSAGGLYAAAVLVDSVGYGGFSAIFVGSGNRRRKGVGVGEVGLRDIVSPIWAAATGWSQLGIGD